MSVTRLKRKHRKNIARANNEVKKIKELLRTPVLKNVDLDELKAKFSQPAPPDVAALSNQAHVPPTDQAVAESQAALAQKLADLPATAAQPETGSAPKAEETTPKAEAKPEAEETKPKAEAHSESLFDRVTHAASAAYEAVQHAATEAAEAVAHSSVVEKAKEVASNAVDAVAHSAAYEAVQQAAHNVVEGTRQVIEEQEQPEPAKNAEAQVNQTGTVGFDEAEALTKPVTEEGQAGDHPKPSIHL